MKTIKEKLFDLLNVADELEEKGFDYEVKQIREIVDELFEDVNNVKKIVSKQKKEKNNDNCKNNG